MMGIREWLMIGGMLLSCIAGMAAVIRWLFSGWMETREAEEKMVHSEVHDLRDQIRSLMGDRLGCQSRHDRDMAELRVDLAMHYPRREELNTIQQRIELKMDALLVKIDELKEEMLRGGNA